MANYKEHNAYLSKHGLARTNRFQVLIEVPEKMVKKAEKKKESKLAKIFGEVVKVIKIFTGGDSSKITRGLDIMCSQTELPGKNLNVSEVRYNGDTFKMGQSIMYGQQQFTFKVSGDMYEKNVIDEWMKLIVNPITNEVGYLKDYATVITIFQLDMNDKIVHAVSLMDAFPVMLNPMTLSNSESNNTHEMMVQFAYRSWINLETDPDKHGGVNSLLQTPLGPYLAPILSNPAVQRGLEFVKDKTGLDLEGEAVNVYNQIDGIITSTTGQSINKSVGLLNGMKAHISVNDKISNNQAAQLLDYVDGAIGKFVN